MSGPHWIVGQDGEDELREMYERHYSSQDAKQRRQKRRTKLFCGPGAKFVLTTPTRTALFVWRKFEDDCKPKQHGVNCAIFRNEKSEVLASDLIREADAIADRIWPSERHYTYVRAAAVESRNPGWCFICAGWVRCGTTSNGLLIFERVQ